MAVRQAMMAQAIRDATQAVRAEGRRQGPAQKTIPEMIQVTGPITAATIIETDIEVVPPTDDTEITVLVHTLARDPETKPRRQRTL